MPESVERDREDDDRAGDDLLDPDGQIYLRASTPAATSFPARPIQRAASITTSTSRKP
jgi:hypothetical protein